jgi:hypothetical protein
MIRGDRLLAANGNSRTGRVISRSGDTTAKNKGGPSHDYQSRISRDRPVYGCPQCREAAMQFYAADPRVSERTDCFRCHACGTCWEV